MPEAMNPAGADLALPVDGEVAFTIAAVERDTRISKDTLRIWERRYGFPLPSRDSNGERLYTQEQVERLRHVKRLMDAGHRPGRIVALGLDDLRRLGDRSDPHAVAPQARPASQHVGVDVGAELLQLLRRQEPRALRRALNQQLLIRGLARFIGEVVIPLLVDVGQAWSRGQLEVYEEHLCSEILESVLRGAITSLPDPPTHAAPRVLLATLPIEAHGLGLLMAEALFGTVACDCTNLGRQTPLSDVVKAAQACRIDIVALSFSTAVNTHQALETLGDLRAALPAAVELWAGCTLPVLQRRCPPGVQVLARLEDIELQVARWRGQGRPLADRA
jgi:DNA-binding transcriptional MerR regulator/methylmalonyl-CoA mutase cobalamin-binding subunit